MDKVKNLGQVYTPDIIVKFMISLIKNKGNILEPSSGQGAFSDYLSKNTDLDLTSIEIDPSNYKNGFIIMDFFDYDLKNKFDTIIGNPPYVAAKSISTDTFSKIEKINYLNEYEKRSNLFIYFIRKCISHLKRNGEIIFITPRDFIKSTSSIKLNEFLHENGTITDWYEYGDEIVFKDYRPNVAVWRYEKDNFTRQTKTNNGLKNFLVNKGQIFFMNDHKNIKFSDLFFVKVGAASGKDSLFTSSEGNKDFVCSYTKRTGHLKKMIYNQKHPSLLKYKEELINRKIKKINENNWWEWGRRLYESDSDRIYVNCKTRDSEPFFLNDCKNYDGSILGIFPKENIDLNKAVKMLNDVDWSELGFKIGGRYSFNQKSLENTFLPEKFAFLLNNS